MEIYMEFTKYMVAILVIYIYNQHICKKNVLNLILQGGNDVGLVFPGVKGFFLILLSNL